MAHDLPGPGLQSLTSQPSFHWPQSHSELALWHLEHTHMLAQNSLRRQSAAGSDPTALAAMGSLASTNIPETTIQDLGFSVNLTFTYLRNIPLSIGQFDNCCLFYSSSKFHHEKFVLLIPADKKKIEISNEKTV